MDFVQTVPYNNILNIRRQVLWPKKSLDFVRMPFDKSDNIMHLGIKRDKFISVVTINIDRNSMQICQFATLPTYQGQGLGKKLMEHIFKLVKIFNINKLWCNARENMCWFYEKYGLKKTDYSYVRNGINIIQMELNL